MLTKNENTVKHISEWNSWVTSKTRDFLKKIFRILHYLFPTVWNIESFFQIHNHVRHLFLWVETVYEKCFFNFSLPPMWLWQEIYSLSNRFQGQCLQHVVHRSWDFQIRLCTWSWGFQIRLCVFGCPCGGKARAQSTSAEHLYRKPCMNWTAVVVSVLF